MVQRVAYGLGFKISVWVLGASLCGPMAWAEWAPVSQSLPEVDIRYVMADPKEPRHLYAASPRRLYKSVDQGLVWKRILSLRATTDALHGLYFDPQDGSRVYAATQKGIRYSQDKGNKWSMLYQGMGDDSKIVHAITSHPKKSGKLLAATGEGLLEIDKVTGLATKIAGIPKSDIFSIWADPSGVIVVTSSQGIWKSADGAESWTRVFVQAREERPGDGSLEQFQIEEMSLAPKFSNIVHMSGDRLFAASSQGVLAGSLSKAEWGLDKSTAFSQKIQYLAASPGTLYAATDKGVFAKGVEQDNFQNLSDGLGSLQVNMLHFNKNNNTLYAATQKGVYRYVYPELKIQSSRELIKTVDAGEVLGQFAHEPTVLEIQQAAIRYAEVHPEKIEAWRQAAMKKALLPSLSLGADMSRDQNIDLDRGGTNDPDKFIAGPEEKSTDWSVGVSWDLGDLVWNDDQTSIDSRSKLMVELRDDVLTEVTHLYYERRRLQVDLLLAPPQDIALAVEKDLKLQEFTASIDALTGGYLSKKLGG